MRKRRGFLLAVGVLLAAVAGVLVSIRCGRARYSMGILDVIVRFFCGGGGGVPIVV